MAAVPGQMLVNAESVSGLMLVKVTNGSMQVSETNDAGLMKVRATTTTGQMTLVVNS